MNRILPHSDEEIAERIALRRACNDGARKALKAAQSRAEREHFATARARAHPRFSDDVVRDAARMTFKFTPTEKDLAEVAQFQADAAEALPPEIKSERWQVGDCGCVVERVYHVDTPEAAQTFAAEPCAAHAGLSLDELHVTHERETRLRCMAHRKLVEDFADAFTEEKDGQRVEKGWGLSFGWEGEGKARAVVVHSCHLTDEHDDALCALACELGEDGAIKSTLTDERRAVAERKG